MDKILCTSPYMQQIHGRSEHFWIVATGVVIFFASGFFGVAKRADRADRQSRPCCHSHREQKVDFGGANSCCSCAWSICSISHFWYPQKSEAAQLYSAGREKGWGGGTSRRTSAGVGKSERFLICSLTCPIRKEFCATPADFQSTWTTICRSKLPQCSHTTFTTWICSSKCTVLWKLPWRVSGPIQLGQAAQWICLWPWFALLPDEDSEAQLQVDVPAKILQRAGQKWKWEAMGSCMSIYDDLFI